MKVCSEAQKILFGKTRKRLFLKIFERQNIRQAKIFDDISP